MRKLVGVCCYGLVIKYLLEGAGGNNWMCHEVIEIVGSPPNIFAGTDQAFDNFPQSLRLRGA